jgi:hypothetical protein
MNSHTKLSIENNEINETSDPLFADVPYHLTCTYNDWIEIYHQLLSLPIWKTNREENHLFVDILKKYDKLIYEITNLDSNQIYLPIDKIYTEYTKSHNDLLEYKHLLNMNCQRKLDIFSSLVNKQLNDINRSFNCR